MMKTVFFVLAAANLFNLSVAVEASTSHNMGGKSYCTVPAELYIPKEPNDQVSTQGKSYCLRWHPTMEEEVKQIEDAKEAALWKAESMCGAKAKAKAVPGAISLEHRAFTYEFSPFDSCHYIRACAIFDCIRLESRD